MVISLLIILLVDLKQIFFFISLKRVRIWLESKTPDELKANLRRFNIEIGLFLGFTSLAVLGVILALLINH